MTPPRAPVLVPSRRWDASVWTRFPALASTAAAASGFAHHTDFPTCLELSALVRSYRSAGGAGLSFERQTKKKRVTSLAQAYDARIFHEGAIPTREGSWHDLFNALTWVSFPTAKRWVNARQYAALAEVFGARGTMPRSRTREQDALAMLDEGALLLVTTKASESALRGALFANDQPRVHALIAGGEVLTLVFGHALAEHTVSSESMVRGLPVVLPVAAGSFERGPGSAELLRAVDEALAVELEGPFARATGAGSATGGVVALDLRAELFAGSPRSGPSGGMAGGQQAGC